MDSQCQLKRSFAYAGLGSKCFIFYCYIIYISSCTSAKQTTPAYRLRLSTALTQSCMLSGYKRYTLVVADGDSRYRAQQIPGKPANIAASILYFCEFKILFLRSKERLHRGKFLSNGHIGRLHQHM
jgi:hypothetical protein